MQDVESTLWDDPVTSSAHDRESSAFKASSVVAGIINGVLLLSVGLLHVGRLSACERQASLTTAPKGKSWDWMCEDERFLELAFLPMHALAFFAFVARLLHLLQDGSGTVWRAIFCGRSAQQGGSERFATARLLEIFVGAYTLCWFAPADLNSKPASPIGCIDLNESCAAWAASGECSRNEAFMRANCLAACNLCPKPRTNRSAGTILWTLFYLNGGALIGSEHWPRCLAITLGGPLLLLAAARLLMPGALTRTESVAVAAA